MDVLFDDSIHDLDVRKRWLVVVLNEFLNLQRALPVDGLHVQAEIEVEQGW